MISSYQLKQWLKQSDSPYAQAIVNGAKSLLQGSLPLPLWPYRIITPLAQTLRTAATELVRILWHTPCFKTRLVNAPKQLYLYCGQPYTNSALDIFMGERCRISGITTFTGRATGKEKAQLHIGNNVGISWQTTIAVGTQVILKDNVRIAGRAFLAGYPGHPVNPSARAQGLPDTDNQVGDIILDENVWLGTGCTVLAGVHIGANTIVGASSVVTKSLPAGVIAAGNPAKVIRNLTPEELAAPTTVEL